ncbi:MAG: hypothetical protein ACRYGG_14415 [Janthinobacterium lividum]
MAFTQALISLLPRIRTQARLSDQDFTLLSKEFSTTLSQVDDIKLKDLIKNYKQGQLTFDDIYDLFFFATSLFNVNRNDSLISLSLAKFTLIFRMLIAQKLITIREESLEINQQSSGGDLKFLLYQYPDMFSDREINNEINNFKNLTLKNYLKLDGPGDKGSAVPDRRQMLDINFPPVLLKQMLTHEDLTLLNKVVYSVNENIES